MEKILNDKVVIPEKYKRMSKEEIQAEIRRLEEKNGFTQTHPKKAPAVFRTKPSGAV